MSHVNKLWIEGYVFDVTEKKKKFYTMFQKRCYMHDINISKSEISSIINRGKKITLQSLFLRGKKNPKEYP